MNIDITQANDGTYCVGNITGVTFDDIVAPSIEIEKGFFIPSFAEAHHFNDDEMVYIKDTIETLEQDKQYKNTIRKHIKDKAGDTLSILGTTADAAQMLLYIQCKNLVALHNAKSFAEYQNAMQEYYPLAKTFLDDVSSGKAKLPFMVKGMDAVLSDVEMRSTQVAEVFENMRKKS